jgi:hypothetical protein
MFTKRPITTDEATTMMVGRRSSGGSIRSPLGLLAALTLLSALPIALGYQILFGSGGGTTIHFALAAGCVVLSFSVFDFKLPRWINWIGCAAALAFILLILTGVFLMGGHPYPAGTLAFGCFFLAAAWLEFAQRVR